MNNDLLISVFSLVVLLLSISTAYAESCSDSSDCGTGESCVYDTENPIFVEECFLWIFCDSYTLYPLVCEVIPDEEPAPPAEEDEIVIACINDIAVVRGFCLLLRYFIDPSSIEELWEELADTWVFGRRAEE